MRQHAVRIVIGVVVVLFLIASAFVNGVRWGKKRTKVGELIIYARRAETVELQYRIADPASAESALRGFLKMCDEMLAADNELLSTAELAHDRTMTLARLHLLREGIGDSEGARTYLERASESCTDAGWRDCSKAGVLSVLEESERRLDGGQSRVSP